MGQSTTIKTRLGDVTIAARGECQSVEAGPLVTAAFTIGYATSPVRMSIAQARAVASIFTDAANAAELALKAAARNQGVA